MPCLTSMVLRGNARRMTPLRQVGFSSNMSEKAIGTASLRAWAFWHAENVSGDVSDEGTLNCVPGLCHSCRQAAVNRAKARAFWWWKPQWYSRKSLEQCSRSGVRSACYDVAMALLVGRHVRWPQFKFGTRIAAHAPHWQEKKSHVGSQAR